ncbi:MAG: uroporphyrinogen decarboxylase family protein [Armatimonadota bacterium]|nr:uroporphyrinogen decarboxylase family protein [Armatimonadota bacterium]
MTSRERLLAAIRGDRVDRVPVAPFGLGRLDPNSEICRELIARTDPFISPGAGGDPFLGSAVPTTTTVEGDVTTTVFHTPKGNLTRRWRRTAATAAQVEYPLRTPADVEKALAMPYAPPAINLKPYREWKERVGDEALVMVGLANAICTPASWFSPEDFCLAWADAPDVLRQLCQVASDRLLAFVTRLLDEGVDAFRIVGGEYASVQLGPEAFRALVTPFDTELVDLIRRRGAIAYYHNHGKVMQYLEMLADLGIDALDPLEAPPWGDTDLREAMRRIGDRVCLVGNLDDMEIINQWPTDEVLALARERLAAAGNRHFILGGTASGTYTEHGARNFIAMAEMVARET